MHLTATCTGLSHVALKGIQALGENALLLCNNSVYNKENKMKLSSWTKQTQKKEMKNLDSGMKDIKTSFEENKSILQRKQPAETQNKTMSSTKENIPAQDELTGIRIRGADESNDKNLRIRHKHALAVKKILSHLEIVADIGDFFRLGKFD